MEKVYIVISTNYDNPFIEDTITAFKEKDKAQEFLNNEALKIRNKLEKFWEEEGWTFLSADLEAVIMQNRKNEWYSITLVEKELE